MALLSAGKRNIISGPRGYRLSDKRHLSKPGAPHSVSQTSMPSKDYQILEHLKTRRGVTREVLQAEQHPAWRKIHAQSLQIIERRIAELEERLNGMVSPAAQKTARSS
jgi:hypothetical protein